MPGYGFQLGNGITHLGETACSLVPQIVKMQIIDAEFVTCPRERGTDRVRLHRENPVADNVHSIDYRAAWIGQVAPNVVPNLVSGVLHIPHEDSFCFAVVVGPKETSYLSLTPR